VQAALRDSEFGQAPAAWRISPAFGWAGLALLVGAGLGATLYAQLEKHKPATAAASEPPAERVAAATVPPAGSPTADSRTASTVASAPAASKAPAESASPAPSAAPATAAAPTPQRAESVAPAGTVVAQATAAPAPAPERQSAALPSRPGPLPGTVAPTSAPSSAAPRDVIDHRMQATERWLKGEVNDVFSIQLLVAGDEEQLRNHLKALPKFIEVNDIYMYRSAAHGRPMVNVLWGSFADRKAAQEELAVLPPSLRANRPYVRTISGIRAEIERLRDSGRR
jgi:septal ring-binding cell division protein DamX